MRISRVLFIVSVLFFSVTLTGFAEPLTAFTADHWVHQAISSLATPHILGVDEIPERMSRYEAAMIVAKLLHQLDQSQRVTARFGVNRDVVLADLVLQYNQQMPQESQLSVYDQELLSALAAEFNAELKVLGLTVYGSASTILDPQLTSGRPLFQAESPLGFAANGSVTDDSGLNDSQAESSKQSRPSKDLRIVDYPRRISIDQLNSYYGGYVTDERVSGRDEELLGLWERRLGNEQQAPRIINSNVPISDDWILEARYEYLPAYDGDDESRIISGVAGLSGQYVVTPDLILEGELLHNPDSSLGSGAVQLGATWRFGDLELGGIIRQLQSGFRPLDSQPISGSLAGYGLSLRVGELALSTMRDQRLGLTDDQPYTITSVDVSYGLPNSFSLQAGFQQTDDWKTIAELGQPTLATVGVDIPIPQGRLRLGMTSERMTGQAVGVSDLPGDEGLDSVMRKTAVVGLSYLLNNDTTLQLNYKLIDFNDVTGRYDEKKLNVASAEFSIRF